MARRSIVRRTARRGRRVAAAAARLLFDMYEEARETVRHQGVALLLWEMFQNALSPLWEIEAEIWFAKDLSEVSDHPHPTLDLRIAEAEPDDVPAIVACLIEEDLPLDPDELVEETRKLTRVQLSKMRMGGTCFLARVDGELVHINWTLYRITASMLSSAVLLDYEEVVTTDAYTAPRWRGKGIHSVVLNHMLGVAHSRGRETAYTMTLLWNRPSRKGIIPLGWRRSGTLFYIRSEHTGKVRAVWLGPESGPFALLHMEDRQFLWQRRYRLRNGRCLMFAAFLTVRPR
jgi:GNAT superfamily N-acetyltransferase